MRFTQIRKVFAREDGEFDLIAFARANAKPLVAAAVVFFLVGQVSPAQWGVIPLAAGVAAFFAARAFLFKD